MSLPDFFFERITSEIHQQMEGVLALAERLARQPLGADAQACVAGVSEAAACVRQILASSADLKAAATQGMVFDPAPKRVRAPAGRADGCDPRRPRTRRGPHPAERGQRRRNATLIGSHRRSA